VDYKGAAAEFLELERNRERDNLLDLFTKETGYNEADALAMFKNSAKQSHISKWGIAVPVTGGSYDLLLGFHFSERYLGAFAHFLPDYAIDAQTSINVRVLPDADPDVVISELIWNHSTEALLVGLREELLNRGLHPKGVFDSDGICQRFRNTLAFRAEARSSVDEIRPDIGAVICLVGTDLVLTTKGIEHVRLRQTEPIPFWATFKRAGLKTRARREAPPVEDQEWFERSGFAGHPDMGNAIVAIRVLYRSRFLSGLVDGDLRSAP
jgi:hypothetical protein